MIPKIKEVFLRPINEADFKKTEWNKEGIKCKSITIPENRCGINEWFKRFTV